MIQRYLESYDVYREDLNDRYVPPSSIATILKSKNYPFEVIGHSVNGLPIYLLKVGEGNTKILLWSQMHGNESTATRAMFDLWNLLYSNETFINELLKNIEIHFIPQLNPDGALTYNRLNADQLDLNRDFNECKSPEMKVLKDLVESNKYDVLFNLHDQRTIFHPEGQSVPATLSFLAPVVDQQKSLPTNRLEAMRIISRMVSELSDYLPNQLAKFSDEFYPEATGDNFQRLSYTTILVECGHYPNDYNRDTTRKFTYYALLSAVIGIAHNTIARSIEAYEALPQNDNKAVDILYKNVLLKTEPNEKTVDLAIQYEEVLNNDKIEFVAKIHLMGDLTNYFGHDVYHAENRIFHNDMNNEPKIGEIANFKLSEWIIENGKPINNDQ